MSSPSSSSREYSPDWLHSTPNTNQEPTTAIFTLSSSSSDDDKSPPPPTSDKDDDQLPISSILNLNNNNNQGTSSSSKVRAKSTPPVEEPNNDISLWTTLLSDSDHDLSDQQLTKEDDVDISSRKPSLKLKQSPQKRLNSEPKDKTLTKQEKDEEGLKVSERETTIDKQTGPYISSSTLPLVLADKLQRSKALVECEGESIDLSGDLGSVGRVVISDSPSGDQDMLLDLKGTIYKTTIIPSRTFCVVSFGQSEAKIEAIMNDFIQLKPQSNVYEAETMVEGTLEGFSFDSEDEADKHTIHPTDENEDAEPQTNGKGRRKSEKTSEAAKKKGKTAVKKPAKKVKRKAPVAKKPKSKK